MLRRIVVCGLLVGGLSLAAIGADNQSAKSESVKNAGFEKLKTLVGTWTVADKDGKPTGEVVSVIKLTAGGSALHETLFPGSDHEMISIYTPDGSDVIMTHYCMLGNQPRMKASGKSVTDTLDFKFDGGTNLDPKKDKHMHAAKLKIVDADHIEIDGEAWSNGAPDKEMCHGQKLARQK